MPPINNKGVRKQTVQTKDRKNHTKSNKQTTVIYNDSRNLVE